MAKLPEIVFKKPSKLIRLALNDLAKVERSKSYSIYMGAWHTPIGPNCAVCLAGAVMAKTLETPISNEVGPLSFDVRTRYALEAIDDFRCGSVADGLETLGLDDAGVLDRPITPYSRNRARFKTDMRKLVKELEAEGL